MREELIESTSHEREGKERYLEETDDTPVSILPPPSKKYLFTYTNECDQVIIVVRIILSHKCFSTTFTTQI